MTSARDPYRPEGDRSVSAAAREAPSPPAVEPVLADGVFGARVRLGPTPGAIVRPTLVRRRVQASAYEALLTSARGDRARITGGREVVVEPPAGGDPETLLRWLQGPVAVMVLGQQGRFALHATTVRIGPVAVAVTGPSGAGKSTLAAALVARGHQVVADDVSAVDLVAGSALVPSTTRALRLHPATAAHLGAVPSTGQVSPDPSGKIAIEVARCDGPVPLALVIALGSSPEVDAPVADRLGGMEAVQAIRAQTYGPAPSRLWPDRHLRWVGQLVARVPVVRLVRPRGMSTITAVADLVDSLLRSGPDRSPDGPGAPATVTAVRATAR